MLEAVAYNQNRQQSRLKLMESGLVFNRKGEEVVQESRLGGVLVGRRAPENWTSGRGVRFLRCQG